MAFFFFFFNEKITKSISLPNTDFVFDKEFDLQTLFRINKRIVAVALRPVHFFLSGTSNGVSVIAEGFNAVV